MSRSSTPVSGFLVESNLTSWSVDAPDALTACCGWVRRGMRDEDDGNTCHVTVRPLAGGDVAYPFRGLTGEDLIEFQRDNRSEIDQAASTVRLIGHVDRQLHRQSGELTSAHRRIGALEQKCRAVAGELDEIMCGAAAATSDQMAHLKGVLLEGVS